MDQLVDNGFKNKILSMSQVEQLTSYSRASIYRLIAKGVFPPPLKLGPMKIGFVEDEIRQFLASRPRAVLKSSAE